MGIDNLIPDKPSGYNGHCRSKLSMAADGVGLGLSALTPPVVGAVGPLVSGVESAGKNFMNGHAGDAIGSLLGSLPAAAGGFFGGGVGAADVARGFANEGAVALGANRDNLPASSAQNLAQDATCKNDTLPGTSSQVPASHNHGAPVTKKLPTAGGWRTTVTMNGP